MAKREERNPTPQSYIWSGVILLALAGALGGAIGFDEPGGIIVAVAIGAVGQIVLLIGVIARGVQVGMHSPPKTKYR